MTAKKDRVLAFALAAAAILLVLLTAAFYCRNLTNASLIFGIVIIFFEIAVPIEILKFFKIPARDFNIYAHNIDTVIDLAFPPYGPRKIRPDFLGMGKELWFFAKTSVLVFLPYVLFYWAFWQMLAIRDSAKLVFSLNFPPQIFFEIITQIFVVALPEELFYRGFLQSAFLRKWPNRFQIFGVPAGGAIVLVNIIFALGHFVGSFSPTRLLTFFPGLIFSYFVYKNKSLLSAILFHAACNILSQILYASFFLR